MRRDEAEAILREFAKREQINYGTSQRIRFCVSLSGRDDEGFSCLERAVDKHEPAILTLNTHPGGDSIRGDARYQKLIKGCGPPTITKSRGSRHFLLQVFRLACPS